MSFPRGLSAFPVTPTTAEGRVDVVALGKLVERLAHAGVDTIGVLGSTGGYMYLDREERRRALCAAVDVASGHVPIIAGVGALRTDHAVAFAQYALEAGASAGLLSAVSYAPLSQNEVAAHVLTVAEEGLPIILYDNPTAAGFAFTPALVSRLANAPGILGIKNPTTNTTKTVEDLVEQRAGAPQGFSIGFSGDSLCAEALIAGADAWYSVLAGILPAPCVMIARAVAREDMDEAREINAALAPVWTLFKTHTSLRVVYAMADLLGLTQAAPPLPIQPLSARARQEVEAVLKALPQAFLV